MNGKIETWKVANRQSPRADDIDEVVIAEIAEREAEKELEKNYDKLLDRLTKNTIARRIVADGQFSSREMKNLNSWICLWNWACFQNPG